MRFSKTLMGEKWSIHVVKRMPKHDGTRNAGLTYPLAKRIYLYEQDLSLSTIIHELTHAYHTFLCIETSGMSIDQHEEVYCEFMAKYSAKILNDAIGILLHILDKKTVAIQDEDRSLIGSLYELSLSLDIIGDRLNFTEVANE